jgi:four helix bundle protein
MMMSIESYRDLIVWQKGMALAKECYFITRPFPKDERYGMSLQIRKSSSSVPANIAEGYGRDNTGDYKHFLRIAQGSLKELETHLLLSADVELTSHERVASSLSLADEIGRMLRALIRSLE